MSETQETRPTARTPAEVDTSKAQSTLRLIEELLKEAGPFGINSNRANGAESTAYNKLHQAFRSLFKLSGSDFERGFALFQEAIRKYPNGIFANTMVNRNLEYFNDAAERETYMVFINMIVRFARTPASQKGQFKNTNNIERLLTRVKAADLRATLSALFLA